MNSALIPFGLKGDRMVEVSEVATGLACNCVCPACAQRLVAKKGLARVHHFAHVASEVICAYGAETAIHRMAKQCLLDAGRIFVPGLLCEEAATDDDGIELVESEAVCEAEKLFFDSMLLEETFDNFRPDVIGWLADQPLLIEIAVRHPVGRDKAEQLACAQVACVEIDLSKVDPATITLDELRRLVLDERRTKHWISHPKVAAIREGLRAVLRDRLERSNAAARDRRRPKAHTPMPLEPRALPVPKAPSQSVAFTHRWLVCEQCESVQNAGPYTEAIQLKRFNCSECGHSVGLDPPWVSAGGVQARRTSHNDRL